MPAVLQVPDAGVRERLVAALTDCRLPFHYDGEQLTLADCERSDMLAALSKRLEDADAQRVTVGYRPAGSHRPAGDFVRVSTLTAWARRAGTAWLDECLAADRFTFHFQPIADYTQRRVFAHEALVRLEGDQPRNGAEILAAVFARGAVHRFDSYCRQKALREAARQHQSGQKLFINFQPSSIYDPAHCLRSTLAAMATTHLRPDDVVFEVVETEEVRSVEHLRRIRDFYRGQGFGFALDDVGSGSNSLDMIAELLPDYAKIDKSLTSRLHDPAVLAHVGRLLELAQGLSVEVIAEGIETREQVQVLQELGVRLMQGYLFGRPAARMERELPMLQPLARAAAAAQGSAGLAGSTAVAASETLVAALGTSPEQRLRMFESVLSHASEMVLITEIEPLDPPGPRILYCNPAFTRVTGYSAAEVLGRSPRLLQGPQTDRLQLERIRRALQRREYVHAELINYRKDGTEYWVAMDIVPVHDALGRCTHAVAIQSDITARRRAEEALRQSERHYRTLIENALDIITVLDEQGAIQYESPSIERVLGWRPEDLLGEDAFRLVHPDDREKTWRDFQAMLAQPGVPSRSEFRFQHRDGSWRTLEVMANNLLSEPSVRGIVVNSRDVSDRKLAEAQVRYHAEHDVLSGLANRRYLLERLAAAVETAARQGQPLAVAVGDIDFFKSINDSFGHAAGDEVLSRLGAIVRQTLSAREFAGRLGGDEFCLVFPGRRVEDAEQISEAIRRALRAAVITTERCKFHATITFGVAALQEGQHAAELLQAADQMLYQAKRRGRNRVEVPAER